MIEINFILQKASLQFVQIGQHDVAQKMNHSIANSDVRIFNLREHVFDRVVGSPQDLDLLIAVTVASGAEFFSVGRFGEGPAA